MTRIFHSLATEHDRSLLEQLTLPSTGPIAYRTALTDLGLSLGQTLRATLEPNPSLYLATTNEDADFLAQGILSALEGHARAIHLACFWNQRVAPFQVPGLSIAPILRKYQEPPTTSVNYLVVVKSIISSGCVIKTNLLDLIQTINPDHIVIAAPVLHRDAREALTQEFPEAIAQKFQFLYYAIDDERTANGMVIPGVGGEVYQRLGFADQAEKNSYTPALVKQRRAALVRLQHAV